MAGLMFNRLRVLAVQGWIVIFIKGYLELVAGEVAWGYLLPSQFILDTWIGRKTSVTQLELWTQVRDLTQGIEFVDVTRYRIGNQLLESWAIDTKGKVVFHKKRLLSESSVVAGLLFSLDKKEMTQRLKDLGVPILTLTEQEPFLTQRERRAKEQVYLDRLTYPTKQIAWKIGEGLWFQKDAFHPLRLQLPSGGVVDFIFENSSSGLPWRYPSRVYLAIGGTVFLTGELQKLTERGSFQPNPALFEPLVPELLKEAVSRFYEYFR